MTELLLLILALAFPIGCARLDFWLNEREQRKSISKVKFPTQPKE